MTDKITIPRATWDALREALENVKGCFAAAEVEGLSFSVSETTDERLKDLIERRLMWSVVGLDAALTAANAAQPNQPQDIQMTNTHPDDIAVDKFAAAMKAKMAKQRAKGRGGWDDKEDCPTERLQKMLVGHIAKGDPVDVGNFAMMLWNRGEVTAAPKAPAPRFTECRIELVGAIHTLASHYENRLGRLDPEDRKLADGDIAHAMATAAKWNWNGNGIGGTP